MKKRYRSVTLPGAGGWIFLSLLALCLLLPGPAVAGHRLSDKQCYDCHVVGGALADVVTGSHLIRKTDSRMSQILANGWTPGTPVPCVYCHDTYGRGVRSNMIGVWNDFTTPTSKHPVDPYTSNWDAAKEGGDQTTLDCIDCHDMNVVYYVKGGTASGTTLSPNIHERDVSSVASTPGAGLLTAADTWKNWSTAAGVSPYNVDGNSFCTKQCHDSQTGTGVNANQAAHGYTSPLVTLELPGNVLDTTINGCLDEGGGVGGCHSAHKAADNPDLITQKNAVGTTIRRSDCGACHVFDDPPTSRSTSDFYSNGHGRFSTTNGITCISCHDSAIPHFSADGSANASSPNRLAFAVDSIPSGFSSPAKSRLSICTTCHAGYTEHTSTASSYNPVGCLDCHDPHGYGVSGNVKMMRRVPPIAAPTSTLTYANSGDWYNSAQGGSDFTDWGCDNRDCHAGIGSISSIMNTTTGTHGGGTGIKSGCENCHKHTGGEYSWAATGCDQCHGGSGSYWPAISGSDDGGATPNDAGRHGIHRQVLESRLGYSAGTTNDGEQKAMCRYCHKVGDSDHTSSTRAEVFPAGYAKAIWDTPGQAPSETNASFTAGTNAGTCTDVDCHNNKQTAVGYRWYESSTSTCTMCHTVGTGNPGAFIDPRSGLHDEVPKVSGVQHDDSFAYGASTAGCTTCHTATPSSSHIDGTDDSSIAATGNTAINFSADVNFSDSTVPPTCAPTGGLSGCHIEQSVGESWRRLWHENSDGGGGAGSECAGCHGDFTLGWNNGVMHAGSPLRGNTMHVNTGTLTYQCTDCHGIGATSGNYAFASTTNDWDQNAGETSDHGNAFITMNVNSTSWARSGGRSGCSGCHEGATGTANAHDFPQTSWPAATIQGDVPPTGCDSCHGGSGEYWPNIPSGSPTYAYPKRDGRHPTHINALMAEAGYTTSDADQKEMCQYCHNDPNGAGGANHNDNVEPANVGSFNPIWDSTAADTGSTYNDASDTCTGVNCHNNKTTAANFSWYASSTSTCTMCHDDVTSAGTATGETHMAHTGNQASYGATIICNTCHVNGVVWGTTPPPTGHRNGSWTLSFGYPYGNWTGVSYAGSWAAGTRGGCGTNPCHNDGTGTGSPVRSTYAWGTSMTNDCASCHAGGGMATNKHTQHLSSNALPGTALAFGVTDECVTCHSGTATGAGTASAGLHLNAARDVGFAASFGYEGGAAGRTNTGASTTCSTIRCHNGVTTPSWSAASTIACGDCHHDSVVASSPRPTWEGSVGRSHAVHAGTASDGTGCTNCHTNAGGYTATGGTNHQDLVVDISPSGGTYSDTDGKAGVNYAAADHLDDGTCSGTTCHGTPATLPQWGVSSTVECGSCHGKTRATENRDAWGITPDVQGAPPMTLAADTNRYKVGKHQNHVDNSGALLGDACALCHSGAGSGSGLHADGQTQVVFDAAAGASATYDSSTTPPTCSNLAGSCHGTGQWDSQAVGGCDFCHGYPPNSTNNKHAAGVSAVNHDSSAITPNHQECWYCHGMKNDGSNQPSVMATSVLKGSYVYSVTADHRNGFVTINGDGNVTAGDDAGYMRSGSRGFCTTAACHSGNSSSHAFTVGTGPIQKRDLGPGKCSSCHDTGVSGAPIVTAASTHVDADGAGGTWAPGQCEGCHSGHSGGVEVPLPPSLWDNPGSAAAETWNMQTRLGINYSKTGHNGINLGGPGTAASISSKTTEAEICWGCHGTDTTINEWGLNFDTNGSYPISTISAWAGSHYNYGLLFSDSAWTTPTADWTGPSGTGAFRKDGYQHDSSNGYILSRQIASVHSASFITTEEVSSVASNVSAAGVVTPGILESRGSIRCSYCHDVHNLNRALNDTSSGRPFLRGTWMGNPYGPDMPPLAAYTYPTTGQVGPPIYNNGNRFTTTLDSSTFSVAVPRLFASQSYTRGGYFIDQNSGWPTKNTAYDTVAETAGLCTLCHGTDVSTMDFYSGSSIWRTVNATPNGHANAALGGAGAGDAHAGNLFDARRGNSGTTNVWMGQQRSVPERANGGNVTYGVNTDYGVPQSNGPFKPFGSEPANSGDQYIPASNSGWYGGTPGTVNVGGQYATWFSSTGIGTNGSPGAMRAHRFTCSKCHSPHATGLPALLITNCLDRSTAKWSGAAGIGPGGSAAGSWGDKVQSNCHRKDSTTSGWNRLAPAQ